jgi:multiple sugar transport system substrate-binding protein
LTSAAGMKSAEFYKKLVGIADPASTSWDWSGLAEAFGAGEVAFAPNWHEFASTLENPATSKIAGKIGYSILPKGDTRSANIYGGTGIAINADAPLKEQKAAWLFLIWATAPQTELMVLQSPVGGETPVRTSVYNLDVVKKGMTPGTPESKQMLNLLPMPATLEAWKIENVYMRPKVPQWLQVDTVVYTHLSNMLAGTEAPAAAMTNACKEIDGIVGP